MYFSCCSRCCVICFFFFKPSTAYEMRISDWSSDVCSSDLGTWHDTPIYNRADLQAGDEIDGPAIIAEPNQTIVVEPDWRAVLTRADHWVITRSKPLSTQTDVDASVNPIML